MIKFTFSLSSLCLLLSFAILLSCTFGVPAIFNFGDSNSDTGAMAAAFYWTPLPYGETFFKEPVGRASDGRLLIDFVASQMGLPYLSAYLNSLGANFAHGANFAASSGTISQPRTILPAFGGFSPFYLNVQFQQFVQFKYRSQILRKNGGIFEDLTLPKEEYFREALYTFDIGQNDLTEEFFDKFSIEEVIESVPSIVERFTNHVKKIYHMGGRSFWIHNTGPIGCLAYILTEFPPNTNQTDSVGCSRPHNEVAEYFNHHLKEAIVLLRKDLPLADITFVDVFSIKYSLFKESERFGFELPLVPCCGIGGDYNFDKTRFCGQGSGSCENPSTRIIWDGVHYTDAANRIIFQKICYGSEIYIDGPMPFVCPWLGQQIRNNSLQIPHSSYSSISY